MRTDRLTRRDGDGVISRGGWKRCIAGSEIFRTRSRRLTATVWTQLLSKYIHFPAREPSWSISPWIQFAAQSRHGSNILLNLQVVAHIRRVFSPIAHLPRCLHIRPHRRVILGHSALLVAPEGIARQIRESRVQTIARLFLQLARCLYMTWNILALPP